MAIPPPKGYCLRFHPTRDRDKRYFHRSEMQSLAEEKLGDEPTFKFDTARERNYGPHAVQHFGDFRLLERWRFNALVGYWKRLWRYRSVDASRMNAALAGLEDCMAEVALFIDVKWSQLREFHRLRKRRKAKFGHVDYPPAEAMSLL